MAKRSVIVQFTPTAAGFAATAESAAGSLINIPGLTPDPSFGVVDIPGSAPSPAAASFDPFAVDDVEPTPTRYITRAEIEVEDAERIERENPGVEIYSDPVIEPCIICPGSPAMGNTATVASLIGRAQLQAAGMTGKNVLLAIVDTGFNLQYLRSHGVTAPFDATRSWVPRAGLVPGNLPVNHGTMCAFDATIGAPQATLLDIALLQSTRPGATIMDGLLSDAVLAYRHLLNVMNAPRRPGELRSMVVNNSWGMFHSSWDFPVGSPGNYSHNPNHPFNVIVGTLAKAGADILFAAGNCGRDCPDSRCKGVTNAGIVGANSHCEVISVAGVDATKTRVGYSTSGPGALCRMKPDIASFTHFAGSGVYAADGGTSAATPVAAGVVAAFRSKFHYNPLDARTSSAAVRAVVQRTAEDRGAVGYDFDYGYGVINGRRLAAVSALSIEAPFDITAISRQETAAFEQEMAANIKANESYEIAVRRAAAAA